MKKLIIFLLLSISALMFGNDSEKATKLDYITKIEKVQYEDNEYKAYVKYEQSLSDDGTFGLNIVRLCRSLKILQEKYPNANWLYSDVIDDNGEMIMTASMKIGKANLLDKDDNVEICKEVLNNGNLLLAPDLRAKLQGFINKGEIPLL